MSLFTKEHTVSFRSSQPREKVLNLISDHFDSVGKSIISDTGQIVIESDKYNSFLHNTSVTGTITHRDDKYTITMKGEAKLKWGLIIPLLVCTCGAGWMLVVFKVLMPSGTLAAYFVTALEKIQRDAS